MIIVILRGVFVVLATAVAMLYILGVQLSLGADVGNVLLMLACTLGLAAVVIAVDIYTPRKKLSAVSGVFLGLIAGLLAAYALSFVVDLFGLVVWPDLHTVLEKESIQLNDAERKLLAISQLLQGVKVFIGLITCYIGITLVVQTKDDFRFVIPYVEFARQIRGNRPTILDTSIIIDGRILDIITTNIVQGTVMVPRFVLNELQTISDSGDKLKRARGRRGLDILQKLQASKIVDVTMEDADYEGGNVDQKLVAMALAVKGRLMTNDFNLKKVAELRGVETINLNDLTNALRPVVLPGEHMRVRIQKLGEGASQGVGYMEDGTMVVVENARQHIGEEVIFNVTSNYQTSAGRMIFGVLEGLAPRSAESTGESPPPDSGTADGNDKPRAERHGQGRNPRRS
ncbi:MAG: PIN domain-containing protein [Phycisphaeraceae bacterium]